MPTAKLNRGIVGGKVRAMKSHPHAAASPVVVRLRPRIRAFVGEEELNSGGGREVPTAQVQDLAIEVVPLPRPASASVKPVAVAVA